MKKGDEITMKITRVTDLFFVSSQPDPSDFDVFAKQGFATVVNNRPDGEEPLQPGSAAEETAAITAGLNYAYLPGTRATLSVGAVRAFQTMLALSPGPVVAHCQTGVRSLALYAIGEVLDGRMSTAGVMPFGETLGFNLGGAQSWLAQYEGAEVKPA
jgi:uncharacterized protein (TIGR01244 family)